MVDNIRGVDGMSGMLPSQKAKAAYRLSETASPADSVEISPDVMRLKGIEGIRLDKVMAIRSQIAAGTYFTPDKLDMALDLALDEVMEAL